MNKKPDRSRAIVKTKSRQSWAAIRGASTFSFHSRTPTFSRFLNTLVENVVVGRLHIPCGRASVTTQARTHAEGSCGLHSFLSRNAACVGLAYLFCGYMCAKILLKVMVTRSSRRRPRKMPPLASVDSCPGLGSWSKGTHAIAFCVIGAKDRKSTKKDPFPVSSRGREPS